MSEIVLGAMLFGTRIDESASFALLDRFVERGGRWIDTANNYMFWGHPSGFGGQSEEVIGRWLAARPGARERVRISTKLGGQPTDAARGLDSAEGLSAGVIRRASELSRKRLGVDRIDLYWAHVEDRTVPLEETVGAFGALVTEGAVARLGASNHPAWRVEQGRGIAATTGVEGWTALQLRHSYLRPRPGAPLPASAHRVVTDEVLDFCRTTGVALWAYTALMNGAYVLPSRLDEAYEHRGTTRRLAALDAVAAELGTGRHQTVLAWLLGGTPPIHPIVGATTVERLDEAMDALDLGLDPDQRTRLDEAA
ncbi:aldo/keto reductase [Actinoplanes friuliensis]|uniref:Aldo/keto reductase n=1 Tax=Actinoplanes friuliensis DSM 7358 TaxID=1246995 RepID=U5W6P1_9ACTN|nr:aldo/keto reductase [Actinoplanes friuliensis]AGZ44878.1 aldo/keto reductase [Actinoplanes friuliensis DSM 7358]